jgi:hypothetical protein
METSLSLRDRLLFYLFLLSLVINTPLLVYSTLTLFNTGESKEYTEWQWATFWHTFHHDGKIFIQAGEGRVVHAHHLSLYLQSRTKLWNMLQLRGQIHSPYFYSTPVCTVLCGRGSYSVTHVLDLYRVMFSYIYCKSQDTCVQINHGLKVCSIIGKISFFC